jgi:hypothetical protein
MGFAVALSIVLAISLAVGATEYEFILNAVIKIFGGLK